MAWGFGMVDYTEMIVASKASIQARKERIAAAILRIEASRQRYAASLERVVAGQQRLRAIKSRKAAKAPKRGRRATKFLDLLK